MLRYCGWDRDTMRLEGNSEKAGEDAEISPPSSGFIPINRQPAPPVQGHQLLTPDPSLHLPSVGEHNPRLYNPVVAGYCGIGSDPPSPPSQLELSGTLAVEGNSSRKRRSQSTASKSGKQSKKQKTQPRVSEARRVKKPVSKQVSTPKSKNTPTAESLVASQESINSQRDTTRHETVSQEFHAPLLNSATRTYSTSEISGQTQAFSSLFNEAACALEDDFDDGIDEALATVNLDHLTNDIISADKKNEHEHGHEQSQQRLHDVNDCRDDDIYGGLDDTDMHMLTADYVEPPQSAQSPGHAASTSGTGALESSSSLGTVSLPTTLGQGSGTSLPSKAAGENRLRTSGASRNPPHCFKPIVRKPFPAPVKDRSPIVGLTPDVVLRTCFRIGEALNVGCSAVKDGKDVLLELYARVLSSQRDHVEQQFTFCDLFHKRAPYIRATYNATIWRAAELYEFDSKRLLHHDAICRCIGKMRRQGNGWELVILNIWPAKWDDILWVKGILDF